MRRHSSWLKAIALSVALVACGSPEDTATTTASTTTTVSSTTTTVLEPTPTTTVPDTTTTIADSTTTTTPSSGLPGDPIDFGPEAGDTLAVIGVAYDDVLNLRSAPGADQDILAGIPPLYSDLVAVGETRQLPRSMWIAVDFEGTQGWVNLRYIGFLGDTFDATADVVEDLGEVPEAPSMRELGRIVVENLRSHEQPSDIVLTAAPTEGDLGEVTYDVIGLADDAVKGVRAHVFGQPAASGFTLETVEITSPCARGVDGDGFCI